VTLPLLLIAALAVYRLAFALEREDGPANLFEHIRSLFERGPDWMAKGISCPRCVSFWLGWPAAALVVWGGEWGLFVLLALAISAVIVLLTQVLP
jgi:hypothetical protein